MYDSEGTILYNSEGVDVENQVNIIDPSTKLKTIGNDITNKIIVEEDPDELSKLTQLFTINQKKKQIARANRLSNLLEKVDDEVINRFTERPELIEDRDLLKYWTATSDSLNGKQDDNDIPKIQINNQTNINVNSTGLDRESRSRVLEVVNKLLQEAKENGNDVIDVDVKEV